MSMNVYSKSTDTLTPIAGKSKSVFFVGTTAEWSALSDSDKEKYDGCQVILTDDYESNTFPIYDDLESFIDITKNNIYVFGAFNNGEDYGAPLTRMSFGKVQVQIASSSVIRCIQTLDYSTNSERALTYIRTGVYKNGAWVWGKWCSGNSVYSETEEFIIGTWIDGKPIYRRTIKIESPSESTGTMNFSGVTIEETPVTVLIAVVNADLSSLDIESFIRGYGFFTDSSAMIPIPITYNCRHHVNFWYGLADKKLYCRIGEGYIGEGNYAYITLEYTKTTDE